MTRDEALTSLLTYQTATDTVVTMLVISLVLCVIISLLLVITPEGDNTWDR